MGFDSIKDQAVWSQSVQDNLLYHDNGALTQIKHSRDQQGALEQVAGQFEAMFLQLVLRQMRASSDALADENSPFSSQQYGVFRDMYDGQLAIEMAKKQHAGIADMLVKQLSPTSFEAERTSSAALANLSQPASLPSMETLTSAAVPRGLDAKVQPVMFEPETAPMAANDEPCVIIAEARSQSHIAAGFNGCGAVNMARQSVASQQQPPATVAVSSAFSQPLLRTLEP